MYGAAGGPLQSMTSGEESRDEVGRREGEAGTEPPKEENNRKSK